MSRSIDVGFKALVATCFYCGMTIANDIGGSSEEKIRIPIAGVDASYTGFSSVSIVVIAILVFHLHGTIATWRDLGGSRGGFGVRPLPYFFNRQGRRQALRVWFLFYGIPILAFTAFMANVIWGAQGNFTDSHPVRNIVVLFLVGPLAICGLLYLQIRRCPAKYGKVRIALWVPIALLAYLPISFAIEFVDTLLDPNSSYPWLPGS